MLNHIAIMGRLVKDPELRTTQAGVSVTSFTVAVERDRESNGKRDVDFIDCVAWRQGGEFVSKYFHKGDMICVAGRLESRKWQDKDGNNRVSWEIQADRNYFCGSRNSQSDNGYARAAAAPVNVTYEQTDFDQVYDDGDLPF